MSLTGVEQGETIPSLCLSSYPSLSLSLAPLLSVSLTISVGTSTKRPSTKRPSLQNVLPTKRLPQNVHLYKTSSYTKRPPLQNVLPQNIHRYKTSFTTKRPPSIKKKLQAR
jgi:hypothetical protein